MRTTVDIAAPILDELKRIMREDGGTLGELINGLLAEGLKRRRPEVAARGLAWTSQPMGARVDLDNKEAVYALLNDDGA